MLNIKEKSSECKKNFEKEKVDISWSKLDCQMIKSRFDKED